ncbi:MAG: hypothetical protein QG609_52 [Patescibacteria group bacterium]|nr:hypothetical protein [Patescibacteria group bacterium]
MKKGRVFLIIFVVLFLTVFGFWYLGKINEIKKQKQMETQLQAYEKIIKDNANLELLVANTYYDSLNTTSTSTRYNVNQLKIDQESTIEDIKPYALNIKNILTPYTKPRPNEANLVLEALKTNDFNKLKAIDSSINMHQTAVRQLTTIAVPKTAQLVHLRLVNNLLDQIRLLTQMKNLKQNPELALESASQYPIVASSFFRATDNINVYLENRGIIFAENEQLKLFYNI